MKISEKTKGVFYVLGAALGFAGMMTMIQYIEGIPTFEKAFFRNAVAAILSLILLIRQKIPFKIEKGNRLSVFLRALFGTIGLFCNFYAVEKLNLADAAILNKLSPFFAIVFSIYVLKEKATPFQWAMVATALVGAMLIVKPSGSNVSLVPAISGLIGGMGAGAAYTFLRKATTHGTNGTIIILFFSVFSCLASIPLIAMNFVMPTMKQFLQLCLCGVFGCCGQLCITAAYKHAPAKEISVYDYSQVIFTAIIGFFLFGQIPDWMSFVGYAVIITAAICNFLYNRKRA